jgi:glutamate dehydrogenase
MSEGYTRAQHRWVDSIVASVPQAKRAEDVVGEQFVRQFYAHVTLDDLDDLHAETAAETALSAWAFMQEYQPGATKMRIFSAATKGQAPRVIVEILNDDMPFLVDSLSSELTRQGFVIFSSIHPLLDVTRDAEGKLLTCVPHGKGNSGSHTESLLHFEISTLPTGHTTEQLAADLNQVLDGVRLAVRDWRAMVVRAKDVMAEPRQGAMAEETTAFLEWLCANNFVFLGYEASRMDAISLNGLVAESGSALGLFQSLHPRIHPHGLEGNAGSEQEFLHGAALLEITKSKNPGVVHRPVHMDLVIVKRQDADGKVIGEHRFVGLFTSTVYYQSTDVIPVIRRKVALALEKSGFDPKGHDGKALKTILEFLPRDELFQIDEDELFAMSMGILALEGRPRVKMFTRTDRYERFISCLVFVPREHFSTHMRFRIQDALCEAYNATVDGFTTQLSDAPLARLQVVLRTQPGAIPEVNTLALQTKIRLIASHWQDSLLEQLTAHHGEAEGAKIFHQYREAFPSTYIDNYTAKNALYDLAKIEEAHAGHGLALDLFEKPADPEGVFRIKIYNPDVQIDLSHILPMLENMGLKVVDEFPCLVTPMHYPQGIWIRDFRLRAENGIKPDIAEAKARFEETIARVWRGEAENDPYNKLVLLAGLTWREVGVLRAYGKYFRQATFPYAQETITGTLVAHPDVARMIVALFMALFDPKSGHDGMDQAATLLHGMEGRLAGISNIDEDKILRHYMNVIRATLRTNYFQMNEQGQPKPYLSMKFRSSEVPGLPLPQPFAEIFVYSQRFEGIHLRGGKVARGGLRWSDRREDFRTEILGLMKAQMVKNAVIVPEGSKGGFVLKNPPTTGGRDALMQEGIACYQNFLRGLLDLTDNVVDGKVQPPRDVVRMDGDDPYLVVAADKGTATFSDIANGVSAEYRFWLGDAFASGGSVGYDHKKMAITARGGWISVQRHFREIGVDVQSQDITVIGIGDMAGDVFGNGMLRSRHIRLVGAFNHLHLFLDPTPDPEASFKERERLFNLPRSNWTDYDASLISPGGGVFERSAKVIPLSPQVQQVLGITANSLSPNELIQAMLKAPVDLLWNGGIGTYVKAQFESNAEVGDKSNDNLRINGAQLRCKVIGEGGNLGFTQLGRIEGALKGVRLNTDAIDNSAGVDCSDHEVNIKIALQSAMESGSLTREARDTFLAGMTDEVADLVLRDNILQTQAITIAEQQGVALLEPQAQLIRRLEREGLLNRAIEFLPDEETISQRHSKGQGMTRPELAVLLAYSKMALYRELLNAKLPDDPYFEADLFRYFPKAMQDSFATQIRSHQLRREIIATVVTNSIINRTGSTFFYQLTEDTGMESCDIARAYVIARDAFGLRELWRKIEALNGTVPVEAQVEAFAEINRFVYRMTLWLLRHAPQPLAVGDVVQELASGVALLSDEFDAITAETTRQAFEARRDKHLAGGIPEPLAVQLARLEALASAPDILMVAREYQLSPIAVGNLYFALGMRMKFGWLRRTAIRMPVDARWPRLAVTAVISDLFDQQRRLASTMIKHAGGKADDQTIRSWIDAHATIIGRYDSFMQDLASQDSLDFAMLTVALRHIQALGE